MTASRAQIKNQGNFFATDYDSSTDTHTLQFEISGSAPTVTIDGTNLVGVSTQDDGPEWTSVWGVAGVPFTSADQHSAAASVTDAPTGGQKLIIDDLIVSIGTAMSVTFKEETSGT